MILKFIKSSWKIIISIISAITLIISLIISLYLLDAKYVKVKELTEINNKLDLQHTQLVLCELKILEIKTELSSKEYPNVNQFKDELIKLRTTMQEMKNKLAQLDMDRPDVILYKK